MNSQELQEVASCSCCIAADFMAYRAAYKVADGAAVHRDAEAAQLMKRVDKLRQNFAKLSRTVAPAGAPLVGLLTGQNGLANVQTCREIVERHIAQAFRLRR